MGIDEEVVECITFVMKNRAPLGFFHFRLNLSPASILILANSLGVDQLSVTLRTV